MNLIDKIANKRVLLIILAISVIVFTEYLFLTKYSQTQDISPIETEAAKQPVAINDEAPEEIDAEDLVTVQSKVKSAQEWKEKKFPKPSKNIMDAILRNSRKAGKDSILLTAVVNSGMADYTLNWIESLKRTNQDSKYLVFAIDQKLVDILTENGQGDHVVLMPDDWYGHALTGEFSKWLDSQYTLITHAKSIVVERLLYLGVTVWFSDVDIVFLSPHIYDYLVQKLGIRGGKLNEVLFSQEVEMKLINSGFYVMRPTINNKRLLAESLRISVAESTVTQQRAMNRVIDDMNLSYKNGPIVLLEMTLFPQGRVFFDNKIPTKFGYSPMMAHANWRIADEKRETLKKANMWYINTDDTTQEKS